MVILELFSLNQFLQSAQQFPRCAWPLQVVSFKFHNFGFVDDGSRSLRHVVEKSEYFVVVGETEAYFGKADEQTRLCLDIVLMLFVEGQGLMVIRFFEMLLYFLLYTH